MPSKSKELVLVNLPGVSSFFLKLIFACFLRGQTPASLLILAALTPPDYKVTFSDRKIFWRKRDFQPGKLVAITCYSTNACLVYDVADRFRAVGSTVIIGGPHATQMPQEVLEHCDSVAVGEAESIWAQIVADYEAGDLQKIYKGAPLEDFLTPVYPYFLKLPGFVLRYAGLMLTRGCRFHCDFCTTNGKVRHARIEQVVELAKRAKSRAPIHFADNNIYNDPELAKEFFRQMIPHKIPWFSYATIDIAFDTEALELARKSGCLGFVIGIETLNLKSYPKNLAGAIKTEDDYIKALQAIASYGLHVQGSFILGLDGDTHRDYWRLLRFLLRTAFQCQFHAVGILIVMPFPGSLLYERLKREGRLLNLGPRSTYLPWQVNFRPRNMSPFGLVVWFFVLRTVSLFVSRWGFRIIVLVSLSSVLVYLMVLKLVAADGQGIFIRMLTGGIVLH